MPDPTVTPASDAHRQDDQAARQFDSDDGIARCGATHKDRNACWAHLGSDGTCPNADQHADKQADQPAAGPAPEPSDALMCRTFSDDGLEVVCDRPARYIVWGHLYERRDKGPKCARHLPRSVREQGMVHLTALGIFRQAIYEIPDRVAPTAPTSRDGDVLAAIRAFDERIEGALDGAGIAYEGDDACLDRPTLEWWLSEYRLHFGDLLALTRNARSDTAPAAMVAADPGGISVPTPNQDRIGAAHPDAYVAPVSSTGHRWPCTRFYVTATESDRCTCAPADPTTPTPTPTVDREADCRAAQVLASAGLLYDGTSGHETRIAIARQVLACYGITAPPSVNPALAALAATTDRGEG